MWTRWLAAVPAMITAGGANAQVAARPHYYAHDAVLDRHGVVAPWYTGFNGQLDWRARIAAETLKRYPWTDKPARAPHFVFNGTWAIAADGAITIPKLNDWDNGDLGQRAAYILSGLVDYYRYSGDASVIGLITVQANALLDHGVTSASHPWPRFLVSVPNRGKPYGAPDPRGFIQLDITAEAGLGLVRAYEMLGDKRWLEAATHWALLLARNRRQGEMPWGRYANPQDVPWEDLQTGGVVFLLEFFDELIRAGAHDPKGEILAARDAGRRYLRDVLLPRWIAHDTWGRNYWDWNDPVQAENVTEFAARYLMANPAAFPNWRNDARNILGLFLNRTSVAPESGGGVFSGAWAYQESSGCCGRSNWYGPMELAPVWLELGVRTGDPWATEVGRRQAILATYDGHATGVVEDNIDGGQIVAGAWLKIAHPMALKHTLNAIAWLPDRLGANRESHIVRSTSVLTQVRYGAGSVRYTAFDAPVRSTEVLRLAFRPSAVLADGRALRLRSDLSSPGYTVRSLANGDMIVTVRRDGCRSVEVRAAAPEPSITLSPLPAGRVVARSIDFRGNRVRLIGSVGPDGGQADVTLDGVKQLCGIDTWSPVRRDGQTVWFTNGLTDGRHQLRITATRRGGPLSSGSRVALAQAVWSAGGASAGFGEGGGPRGAQRVVFGYAGRRDLTDAQGVAWRPATEWIVRSGTLTDAVAQAWWTDPRRWSVAGADAPQLYRYGAHAREFTHVFTVGPGLYHLRIKLMESRSLPVNERLMDVLVEGGPSLERLDVAATAGGVGRAADLVFNGLRPTAGTIAVTFRGLGYAEAIVQAMEVGPGEARGGARPVRVPEARVQGAGNLLRNPGFEQTAAGVVGDLGTKQVAADWTYLFLSPIRSYVWAESDYAQHPDWGMPEIAEGKQALRTHTESDGHTLVYQEVGVVPGRECEASVMVRAADLRGKGFGRGAGDRAQLAIEEISAGGQCMARHLSEAVTAAGPFRKLRVRFKPAAAKLRFVLEAELHVTYDQGHVTWDACELRAAR